MNINNQFHLRHLNGSSLVIIVNCNVLYRLRSRLSLTSYFSLSVFLGIITSGIGTGAVLLAFLKAWFKEIVIEFGKVTVDADRGYFLRVQQKGEKVKEKAKSAEGHLTLENTPYEYARTVWADRQKRRGDIGEREDLFLFKLSSADLIIFPSADSEHENERGYFPNLHSYNECANKILKVQLSFDNVKSPKPY